LLQQANVSVNFEASTTPHIDIDGVLLLQTDGRSATEIAADLAFNDVVVFDLALDYASADRVAVAKADQCSDAALDKAIGFLQALVKSVSVLNDVPGLVVMRTVCMLANEAADAVNQGVAEANDIDTAMCKGVNYPKGPLAWANTLGVAVVFDVLNKLYNSYGEDRYRPSVLLRRKAITGSEF
jgi:3-hydroxybutyryl-CoA dehydrogenase